MIFRTTDTFFSHLRQSAGAGVKKSEGRCEKVGRKERYINVVNQERQGGLLAFDHGTSAEDEFLSIV